MIEWIQEVTANPETVKLSPGSADASYDRDPTFPAYLPPTMAPASANPDLPKLLVMDLSGYFPAFIPQANRIMHCNLTSAITG